MHRDYTCLSLIQPQLRENNWAQAHISNPDVKLVFPNAVSLVTQTTLNIRPNAQHWMATQNKLNGIFVDYCLIILQQNLFLPDFYLVLNFKSFAYVIWLQFFCLFLCLFYIACLFVGDKVGLGNHIVCSGTLL